MYKVYLAGGMEYATNGEGWRKRAEKELYYYGISVWNPYASEEETLKNMLLSPEYVKSLDKEEDYIIVSKAMSKIVKTDLDVIANGVDAVLVKYDRAVLRGAGTHAEISLAHYINKPVHVWLDGFTLRNVPYWALGCFSSLSYTLEDAVKEVLKERSDEYTT